MGRGRMQWSLMIIIAMDIHICSTISEKLGYLFGDAVAPMQQPEVCPRNRHAY